MLLVSIIFYLIVELIPLFFIIKNSESGELLINLGKFAAVSILFTIFYGALIWWC